MFFTQKQFQDPDSPEKQSVQDDIFNFDDEDDDIEQYQQQNTNLMKMDQLEKVQKETNIIYLGEEESQQLQNQNSPTSGLFGIQQRLMEDSDSDESQIDQFNQIEMEEEIKNQKEIKKKLPKINLQSDSSERSYSPEKSKSPEKERRESPVRGEFSKRQSVKGQIQRILPELYLPGHISDMNIFLNTPVEEGYMMQCLVERQKSGMDYFYPNYNLLISDNYQYLMTAKKKSLQRTSYYLLTTDKNKLSRHSSSFLGKIRSNFLGTEYSVYDQGQNPDKTQSLDTIRSQLGIVYYESNFSKTSEPRRMSVVIPEILRNGPKIFKPLNSSDGIQKEIQQKVPKGIYVLKNKQPKWNDKTNTFVLKFSKRVKLPSIKNFQLINLHDERNVLLQFGKTDSNQYNLDFQHPLTPLQAFSICISAFDYKLGST